MQNLKGVIKTFTIILIIVCFIQLSFTWLAKSVESKADAYASDKAGTAQLTGLSATEQLTYQDSLARVHSINRRNYLDSVSNLPIVGGLDFLTYHFCRDNSLKLGLDLKGGMSLIMEISEDDVLRRLANNNKGEVFNKAIDNAKKAQANTQTDFLTLFQKEFEALNKDAKLAAIFANVELYQGKISFNASNDEVIKILRVDFENALENTFKVLKTRIDQFGVASPNISFQKSTGRIMLELPGVEDPSRVRKLLQQTAQLEFWDTYDNRELIGFLGNAYENANALKAKKEETPTLVVDSAATATTLTDSTAKSGSLLDSLAEQTTEVAKDTTKGVDDISPLRKVLEPRFSQEGGAGEGPVVGLAFGKDTAEVNRLLGNPLVKSAFPPDVRLLWGMKPFGNDGRVYALYAVKVNPSSPEAPLTGKVITDAYQDHDPMSGTFACGIRMNNLGASKWEKMTEAAVGASVDGKKFNRSIAIVLDNRVITAPTVQNKIAGGSSQITGLDNLEEALDLANILKSGKLEAKTVVIEEQIVGPSLGAASIKAGLLSLGVGFLLVFLFMVAYYNRSGVIANVAMFLNMFILICALISFGAAFTLPAMAGILLTLAMAVDANVIINERIREEIARGKGVKLAVEEGYQHSYSAIVDGNLTTMVVSVVLMIFGLGPIYGFGFTLFVGLLTSMFTAVLVSRLLFDWAFNKNIAINFGNSFTNNLFKGTNFDFIRKRKITYGISAFIFIASFASMVLYGFEWGVDFKGGRSYVIQFDKNLSTEEVSKVLEEKLEGTPQVKTYGTSGNQLAITTAFMYDKSGPSTDSIVEATLYEGLKPLYTAQPTFESFRNSSVKSSIKIEASVADDIRKSSVWAIFFGLLGVFAYILIRFRKLEYASGAIVALAHDPILVLGLFSILHKVMPFSLEIDQHIVAAILTLIGYSVNDTVVVYDRIREYIGLHPTKSLEQNVNDSINSTLSRTIMTVFTVFIVSLILFLFGGTPIKGFSFALIVGLLVGTYSSIFIAAPIMVDIKNWLDSRKK
jgi:SecD/SecF fusion protein